MAYDNDGKYHEDWFNAALENCRIGTERSAAWGSILGSAAQAKKDAAKKAADERIEAARVLEEKEKAEQKARSEEEARKAAEVAKLAREAEIARLLRKANDLRAAPLSTATASGLGTTNRTPPGEEDSTREPSFFDPVDEFFNSIIKHGIVVSMIGAATGAIVAKHYGAQEGGLIGGAIAGIVAAFLSLQLAKVVIRVVVFALVTGVILVVCYGVHRYMSRESPATPASTFQHSSEQPVPSLR